MFIPITSDCLNAIDADNELYRFLSLWYQTNGRPEKLRKGLDKVKEINVPDQWQKEQSEILQELAEEFLGELYSQEYTLCYGFRVNQK